MRNRQILDVKLIKKVAFDIYEAIKNGQNLDALQVR